MGTNSIVGTMVVTNSMVGTMVGTNYKLYVQDLRFDVVAAIRQLQNLEAYLLFCTLSA